VLYLQLRIQNGYLNSFFLFGGYVQRRDLPDNWEELVEQRVKLWGTGATIKTVAPKFAAIPAAVAAFAKFERLCGFLPFGNIGCMDALRQSISKASSPPAKPDKKTRKASAGQKEMLMPIQGKKGANETTAKKSASRQRKSA
jgi:hypothetical protein